MADSLGGQLTYSYNGNFQLTGLTLSVSGTLAAQLTFSYDNLDRLAGVSRSAGVGSHVISSSYSYDGANRLTGISYADATSGTPLASFTYGYNADGQVTSYTGPEGTLNYSYDKDGELTGVSGAAQATYSYDANGNRTMSGYQTGPGNELLNDGQFTYTYDRNGNLLSKRDASGDVWSYSWDYRNRLTEVKETNAQNQVVLDETFQYDVNNNLIGEAVNGVPQRWTVYDGSTPYLDLTGTAQVSERYLADPNALAQYWARVGVTGQADWMVTDLLGSVRALVSASGSVEDQIAYDAYGNVVSETNAAAGGRLKYAGGQYDGGLAAYLFGRRWYNPVDGNWWSQDPLGLGPDSNPYRYVDNGPTDGTDPSGLLEWYDFIPFAPLITLPAAAVHYWSEEARGSQLDTRRDEILGRHRDILRLPRQLGPYSYSALTSATYSPSFSDSAARAGRISRPLARLGVEWTAAGGMFVGGSIIARNGIRISGFTAHGVDRAIGDAASHAGTTPAAIIDALRNPTSIRSGIDPLGRPFQVFIGRHARVIVNPQTGRIVSVNPLSRAGDH